MSYNKKALRVDLGKYYKPNPYKKDIITDPAGQWKYPGQVTRIPGNKITMQGVPYPVYGQDDQGNGQMMYPGQNYVFPGNYVDEIPMAQQGLSVNSLVNTPRSLAYNNKKITKGITTLPEIPIHPPQHRVGDSNIENIWEIFDPSGFSSYNDVYDSYQKTGLSPQTMLELVGALPIVGKFGKIEKGLKLGTDFLREAKLSKILRGIDKLGKVSSGKQAYDQYKVGGIPELPLNAGRRAYHAWGYTNNDFIVNRQKGGVNSLEGDLISKVLMNRNKGVGFVDRAFALGANPGTPLFNVPDDEEFGARMSHKMAYGEDDSGQTHMFPTVLNPDNESIPVPNQYADYISSVGYKNATGMNYPEEDYIETDLTPEEIDEYRKGGFVVEELPKAQEGQENVKTLREVPVPYETPDWIKDKRKFGKDKISWYEAFNPKKWGLNDYSDYSSFNSAFRNARESNEDEFVYKGERYNTKLVPKKDSDSYWDSKKFVEEYYKTQPFTKSYSLNFEDAYDARDNYIKEKFGNTLNETFDKMHALEKKYPTAFFDNPEYIKLSHIFDKIALEESTIYENKNLDYQKYIKKLEQKGDKERVKKRVEALNKPTYFSITSQKPKDMSADGYWDPKNNKQFVRTNTEPGKLNTTYVHELSHKADDAVDVLMTVPEIDLKKLNASPFHITQETYDYVSDPSEIEARKLSTLYYFKKNKLPWQAGKIKEEQIGKLYDDYYTDKLPYDIKQLLELYGAQKEDLYKYLNGDYNYSSKPKLAEGGYIELDLTPEEIQQYKDGGYIVEDISVPTLTKAQEGLEQEVYRNQEVPEVPVVAEAPDWLKFSREYENIKSKDAFVEEKKRKYLKQNKGLNKLAGLSMDNFPKEVESNFANEYDYKKNTYVTRKLGKKEGFNPRHRGDWVDELTPGEQKVVANSKYGSKLQPGAYARTLAGLQELANFGIKQLPGTQGDVLKYKIPGLTKREQKEIAESPTGALESFAGLDAPTGYNVINFLKNRGLSTGSNYKELPGLASGELMPNVTADEAMAFNPFTYYGLESIPVAIGKGLGKTGKAADKLVRNAILTGKTKYTAPVVGALAGSAYGLNEDLKGDSDLTKEAGLGIGAAVALGLLKKGKVKPSLEVLTESQKLLDRNKLLSAVTSTKRYDKSAKELSDIVKRENKFNVGYFDNEGPRSEANLLYETFIVPVEKNEGIVENKANTYFLNKDFKGKPGSKNGLWSGLTFRDYNDPRTDLAKITRAEKIKLDDIKKLEDSISNISKDENKLITKESNMFAPVVNTGTSNIVDFRTGEVVPSEVKLPSAEITYTKEGNKLVQDFSEIAEPMVSEKYPEVIRSNRSLVENELAPGSKAFGSSVGVSEGGLKHLSNDMDFLITESDYNKGVRTKHKYIGLNGPAQQHDLFNGKYGENGIMDFNIIHEDANGMVKPVYSQRTVRGVKSLEVELFRQFFPDEFYKQSEIAISKGRDIEIPMTAKQLLDGVDPVVKTILDSYEAGAGYHTGNLPETKAKHVLKPEVYISYGNPDAVSKAQDQYVKSLVGNNGKTAYQFPDSEFSDVDKNMELLMDMDFLGDVYAVAKDPKKMQLALNDFYIRRSIFNREVGETKNLGTIKKALTQWNPKASTHGGNARGHGLNYVEHGYSNHSDIVGNLQLDINPNTSSPAEYVSDIKKKVLGTTELTPDQLYELDKIIEKYLGPEGVNKNKGMITRAKDILNINLGKPYSALPFEPREMFYDIADKLNIPAITDVSSGEYTNSYYTTVLKKIDDSVDALKFTLQKNAPIPKSHSDKKKFFKQLNQKEKLKLIESAKDFDKISNVIDTGIQKSKLRLEALKKDKEALEKLRKDFIEKYKDSKKDDAYKQAERRIKEIESEHELINRQIAALNERKDKIKKVQDMFLPLGIAAAVLTVSGFAMNALNKKVNVEEKEDKLLKNINHLKTYVDIVTPRKFRRMSYDDKVKTLDSLNRLYDDAANPNKSPFLGKELKKYIKDNPSKDWWPNFESIEFKLDPKTNKMRIAAPEKMAPYSKGGTIELELSPDEIKAYQDQGYTIEYLD